MKFSRSILAVVGPAIDSATGLQLQQATAYTTLPGQYPIYAPTAIYSHLPTTTLIPGALASPGKEGSLKSNFLFENFFSLVKFLLELIISIS